MGKPNIYLNGEKKKKWVTPRLTFYISAMIYHEHAFYVFFLIRESG